MSGLTVACYRRRERIMFVAQWVHYVCQDTKTQLSVLLSEPLARKVQFCQLETLFMAFRITCWCWALSLLQ